MREPRLRQDDAFEVRPGVWTSRALIRHNIAHMRREGTAETVRLFIVALLARRAEGRRASA